MKKIRPVDSSGVYVDDPIRIAHGHVTGWIITPDDHAARRAEREALTVDDVLTKYKC